MIDGPGRAQHAGKVAQGIQGPAVRLAGLAERMGKLAEQLGHRRPVCFGQQPDRGLKEPVGMHAAARVENEGGLGGKGREEGQGLGIRGGEVAGRMGAIGEVQVKVEAGQHIATGILAPRIRARLAAGMLDRHSKVDGAGGGFLSGTRGNPGERCRGQVVPGAIEGVASILLAARRARPREDKIAIPDPRIEQLEEALGLGGTGPGCLLLRLGLAADRSSHGGTGEGPWCGGGAGCVWGAIARARRVCHNVVPLVVR
jgi:hypothetical protein